MVWWEMSYYKYKRLDKMHDYYEPDVFEVDEDKEKQMIRKWVYDGLELVTSEPK